MSTDSDPPAGARDRTTAAPSGESATPVGGETTPPESSGGRGDDGPRPPSYHPPPQDEFDWRGWILVGLVVVCFMIIPAAIMHLPQSYGALEASGLSWRQAYLILPLIPAVVLGAAAVWSAVRSREE